ncbi:MAG: DUF3256 family protein [Bacteroidaceae bacterium]|nr:DUF3256 family protein [Bacteroidaceae bacterium]
MKRVLHIAFLLLMSVNAFSADIKELFLNMPNELTPLLSRSAKLDFFDYMEIGMEAKTANNLQGKSEMLFVADDMLSVQMTPASKFDMKLFYRKDSSAVIAIIETVCGEKCDSYMSFYNDKWEELDATDLIELPVLEDYLSKRALKDDQIKDKLGEFIYRFYTIVAKPGENGLQIKITTSEMMDEEVDSRAFEKDVIVYRWNGKRFVLSKK